MITKSDPEKECELKLRLEDLKNIANSFKGSKHVSLQDADNIQTIFDFENKFMDDLV